MSSKKLSEQVALLEDARDHYRAARDELIDVSQKQEAGIVAADQGRARLQEETEGLQAECNDLAKQLQEARSQAEWAGEYLEAAREELQLQVKEAQDAHKSAEDRTRELRAERDRLKADAMSDLITRRWLENQVRSREAERDDLQRQVQEARDESRTLADANLDLQRQLEGARDEVDGLRSQLGIVTRERDEWEANAESVMDALPRVITADELREGQTVAWIDTRHGHLADAGVIRDIARAMSGNLMFNVDPKYGSNIPSAMHCVTECTTIVLLEDAPEPTSYADDDHQDAEVAQRHQPTPRLTVHDLEVAPVGAQVHADNLAVRKDFRGEWVMLGDSNAAYRVSDIAQWPEATLHLPDHVPPPGAPSGSTDYHYAAYPEGEAVRTTDAPLVTRVPAVTKAHCKGEAEHE